MNKFTLVESLLEKPNPLKLKVLDKALSVAIPFNHPHKFKFRKISKQKVCIDIPFIRKNKNHLNGIHACAIATLGEFCAGMLLVSNLGLEQYRYIMSELNCKYTFQGKSNLQGEAEINTQLLKELLTSVSNKEKSNITIKTFVKDEEGNEVAEVTSTWQIKPWKKVKTKL